MNTEALFKDQPFMPDSLPSQEFEPAGVVEGPDVSSSLDPIMTFIPRGKAVAVHSAVDCLFDFVRSLPSPLIPPLIQQRCIQEGYLTLTAAKQILSGLPFTNFYTFIYLMSFFKEMLATHRELNSLKLAKLLVPLFLPLEENRNLISPLISTLSFFPSLMGLGQKPAEPVVDGWNQKKEQFLLHFLE